MLDVDRRVRELAEKLEEGWTDAEVLGWARSKWKVGVQQVRRYLRQAEEFLARTALPDRHQARRRALVQIDALIAQAKAKDDMRALGPLVALSVRLSGAQVAAEEATQPSVWDRLRALLARLDDLNLTTLDAAVPTDRSPAARELAELRAARLCRLLLKADDLAAEFRALGEPPAEEVERRQWVARANAKALYLRLTMPGVPPAARAEAAYRHGGTAGILSSNTELADLAAELRRLAKK